MPETRGRPGRDGVADLAARAAAGAVRPLGGPHAFDEARAAGFRVASVLALFTPTAGARTHPAAPTGVDLFLVRRSPHLSHHPGQIALPGGGNEPGEDAAAAAARETEEETGIPRAAIEVLGPMDRVLVPVSDNLVTPVLGWVTHPGPALGGVDTAEVLHPLRVPVDDLLDPAARAWVQIFGHRSHGFRVADGWVWGFTGNLLAHLFTEIGWDRPWSQERVYAMSPAEARGR